MDDSLNPYLVYLAFFLSGVVFSVLIHRLLLRFSRHFGTRNNHHLVRWSSQVKPAIGGLVFYILFLFSVAVIPFFGLLPAEIYGKEFLGFFAASTLGFFIGLADDAFNTNPILK